MVLQNNYTVAREQQHIYIYSYSRSHVIQICLFGYILVTIYAWISGALDHTNYLFLLPQMPSEGWTGQDLFL